MGSIAQMYSVKGWVAVVTGGGTGIGLMIAKTLASAGAKVYITGRRQNVLEETAKMHGTAKALGNDTGSINPLPCDVTDRESLKSAVKEIAGKEKGVNLLVANAGIARPRVDITKITDVEAYSQAMLDSKPEDWADTFNTNVASVFYSSAAFLPLIKKVGGSIVTISSISGIMKTSQEGQYAYNSSKAATIQLTNLMAKDFAHPAVGVRVNSIAPGYFPSEMTTNTSDGANESHLSAKFAKEHNVPAGRVGDGAEMGQLCLTLALNEYINGQTVAIDGGFLLANP